MRTPVIAGNWKMYKTIEEAQSFWAEISNRQKPEGVEAVICAPYLALPTLVDAARGSGIGIGAQNAHWEKEGAYTGEISVNMLQALGVGYTIVGHSERRAYYAETDGTVNKKTKALLAANIIPIVCVGEQLAERESGETKRVVEQQVKGALDEVPAEDVKRIIIAYEPVWAIGTGKTATAEDAGGVIHFIRQLIAELYDAETAAAVRIQYGGSVKPNNIASFMAHEDIDGALVGGASLDPASYWALVEAAKQ
ncbi:triose-phosphate isomerase [Numidum massiliense]|uniref:triose-phosphate isomerase n=1 Tax=Numidum massiliense TaxID=1522315 RepID=UPI0006D53E01|nr:triose-phosphate isomerase [Numidum massiliense]